jgi:hypothetical protein
VGSIVGVTDGPEEVKEGRGSTQILTQDVVTPNAMHTINEETVGKVCGYTPASDPSSSVSNDFCQIRFYYQEPADREPNAKFDGYDNKCNTPTYLCALEGGYWRSETVGIGPVWAGLTQDDVTVLHYFVAANPNECPNTQPKAVDLDGDNGDIPYLAHDLDIYTPATNVDPGPNVSADGLTDYATAFQPGVPDVPGLPEPVQEVTDTVDETIGGSTEPVSKDRMVEPNNGDPIDGVPENSRDEIEIKRDDPSDCAKLIDSESSDTRDPWVNLLDAQVVPGGTVSTSDASATVSPPNDLDLYGTSEDDHDRANRPGPNLYRTTGKVGVFADKNDDGDYDQVPNGDGPYSADEIQSTGAYPMMWDMHVEDGTQEDPQAAGGGGCADPASPGDIDDAGYGPNTALVQAIYLKEPTTFVEANAEDPRTVEYPLGNNIYVLANEAARTLWSHEENFGPENTVDTKVDALVANLEDHVVDNYGADADSLNVVQPGERVGLGSDFFAQCDEPTGGFTSQLSFAHACGEAAASCEGDTVATMYTFEVDGGLHGDTIGSEDLPPLRPDGTTVYDFDDGTWYDVDPLDNDPGRNDERQGPPAN